MQRRLAAILAADVVGYSRLMGADEVGTLTSLKAHRRELVRTSFFRIDKAMSSLLFVASAGRFTGYGPG